MKIINQLYGRMNF